MAKLMICIDNRPNDDDPRYVLDLYKIYICHVYGPYYRIKEFPGLSWSVSRFISVFKLLEE